MRNFLSGLIVTVLLVLPSATSAFAEYAAFSDCYPSGLKPATADVVPGALRTELYIDILKGKSVGVAANHTSLAGRNHLVDTLLALGVDVRRIFTPEHGFRGRAGAGEHIASGRDEKSGLPIISLYGSSREPDAADLADLDIIVFDIQDVGVRFYTYISTLQLLMEGCAETGVKMLLLDRPNPNGNYVDGPVLDTALRSFIGMQPVPVVYGMTMGEYALMINGEGWLEGGVRCDLEVITCKGYSHDTLYDLPVPPSPNLPDRVAVRLYPSLCFFEGTDISVGRGTPFPFRVFGHPSLTEYPFVFTPRSTEAAPAPPHKDLPCYGLDLSAVIYNGTLPSGRLSLEWLTEAYSNFKDKGSFFNSYFDLLAGNRELREMIIAGKTPGEIRASWRDDLDSFLQIRKKYLLYD
jgi:uncharacterized protein YbbC (DUF1343 family)